MEIKELLSGVRILLIFFFKSKIDGSLNFESGVDETVVEALLAHLFRQEVATEYKARRVRGVFFL